MAISSEFQKKFSELINEQDCTHTALAEKMGIQYDIFSKIKNYGIVPTPRILIRIADFFDVSLEYILARTDNDYFNKSNNPKAFHERLEELRKSKNLTYYALGKKVHISSNYFSDWKTKNYIPSLEYLILLSDFFDISIDYLLGRTDDK